MRPVQRDEDGSIAPLVPVMGFVLLLLGGLIVDSARLLNARGRAVAYAEEAARAGASAIEPGTAVLRLDEGLARQRVEDYCATLRLDDELSGGLTECRLEGFETVADDDGRRIVVRTFVAFRMQTSLLGLVGKRSLSASGGAGARAFEGVDSGDVDSPPPDVEVEFPEEFELPPDLEVEPERDRDGDGVPDRFDPSPNDPDRDGDGVLDGADPDPDDPDVPTPQPDPTTEPDPTTDPTIEPEPTTEPDPTTEPEPTEPPVPPAPPTLSRPR